MLEITKKNIWSRNYNKTEIITILYKRTTASSMLAADCQRMLLCRIVPILSLMLHNSRRLTVKNGSNAKEKKYRHASLLSKTKLTHLSVVTCSLVAVMCVHLCVCVCVYHHRVPRGESTMWKYIGTDRMGCVCVCYIKQRGGCFRK